MTCYNLLLLSKVDCYLLCIFSPLSLVCHKTSCIWYDSQWILTSTIEWMIYNSSLQWPGWCWAVDHTVSDHTERIKNFFFPFYWLLRSYVLLYAWLAPTSATSLWENCLAWRGVHGARMLETTGLQDQLVNPNPVINSVHWMISWKICKV